MEDCEYIAFNCLCLLLLKVTIFVRLMYYIYVYRVVHPNSLKIEFKKIDSLYV